MLFAGLFNPAADTVAVLPLIGQALWILTAAIILLRGPPTPAKVALN